MPGPWRRNVLSVVELSFKYSNRRREARPLATLSPWSYWLAWFEFQPQTRCQAPGDKPDEQSIFSNIKISISDEMPGPWRRDKEQQDRYVSLQWHFESEPF